MMRPDNIGNAHVLQETHLPVIKLATIRYRTLFDCFSEEPYSIIVKPREDSDSTAYEQVMRFRKWIPNNCAYAWYLYATDREWEGENLIVRRVYWDTKRDIHKLKKATPIEREELLQSWPTIKAESVFLNNDITAELKKLVFDFDGIISKGIVLDDRSDTEKCSFSDIELMRRFHWGELSGTWSFEKCNKMIEEKIIFVEERLDTYLQKNHEKIYQMDFDYIFPIDAMKQSIYGT